MKANIQKLQKRRHFTEDFKKKIVDDYERGNFTVLELERLYKISNQSIYRWIYKYSHYNKKSIKVVEMSESSDQKVKELESKIKELERTVGSKQMQIDYLEKMIDIAKSDLGVDIKKNFNTPQSNGSGKTNTK
ncbi:MAG: transposase [Bacteroidales bacterium]